MLFVRTRAPLLPGADRNQAAVMLTTDRSFMVRQRDVKSPMVRSCVFLWVLFVGLSSVSFCMSLFAPRFRARHVDNALHLTLTLFFPGAQYSYDGPDGTLQDLLRRVARLFVGRREYCLLF